MFNEHLPATYTIDFVTFSLGNTASYTDKTNNHFSKTRKIVQIIFGTTREINVFAIKFGRYKLKNKI